MRTISLLALTLGYSVLSFAGTVTYTSSSDFLAALGAQPITTENYGTLSAGQQIAPGSTVDGFTYSNFVLTGGATNLLITNQFNSVSGLSLGAAHGGAQFFFGGEGATVTFAAPVTAFGMFFNVNTNSGNYGFSTSAGSASTGSATYDTGTFVFAGLISTTAFTSATFSSSDTSLGSFNIPELITSASPAVPEPATWMLGMGATLLLALRRR